MSESKRSQLSMPQTVTVVDYLRTIKPQIEAGEYDVANLCVMVESAVKVKCTVNNMESCLDAAGIKLPTSRGGAADAATAQRLTVVEQRLAAIEAALRNPPKGGQLTLAGG